ncbi:glycosyltransferase family 4 protein [Altererythrobacter sp. GH1-8]|uniref:glycosyltransferase family 4 protein n=1 Tax=Altererythrobacter sp. GH1-8 TaxID=3349333 RepID=UPI00374D2F7D
MSDVYIALSADAIVAAECALHPSWSDDALIAQPLHKPAWVNRVMLQESQLLVCPSEFVRDDLVENYGIEPARTVVAPYAVNPKWLLLETEPERGRILFAGSANLRKGIHYLAGAANIMQGDCRVRVAGGVSDKVRFHPDASALEFLGHLGQRELAHEFARADVFVLPSLAEGSASVTAEALGAGIPVVTTRAAGSIVRNGIDGIIVPERNSEAIADAVRSIVLDRERRKEMSRAARHRAQQFGWDGFVETVLSAVRHVEKGAPFYDAFSSAKLPAHRKAS